MASTANQVSENMTQGSLEQIEGLDRMDVQRRLEIFLASEKKEEKIEQVAPILEKYMELGYKIERKNGMFLFATRNYSLSNPEDQKLAEATAAFINEILARAQTASWDNKIEQSTSGGHAYDLVRDVMVPSLSKGFSDKDIQNHAVQEIRVQKNGNNAMNALLQSIDRNSLGAAQQKEYDQASQLLESAMQDAGMTMSETQRAAMDLNNQSWGASRWASNAIATVPGWVGGGLGSVAGHVGGGLAVGTVNMASGFTHETAKGLRSTETGNKAVNKTTEILDKVHDHASYMIPLIAGGVGIWGVLKLNNPLLKLLACMPLLLSYKTFSNGHNMFSDAAGFMSSLLGGKPAMAKANPDRTSTPAKAPENIGMSERDQLEAKAMERLGLSKEDAEILATWLDAPMHKILQAVQPDTAAKLKDKDSRWDVKVDLYSGDIFDKDAKEHLKSGKGQIDKASIERSFSNLLQQVGATWRSDIIAKEGNAFSQERTDPYLGMMVMQRFFSEDGKKELSSPTEGVINGNTPLSLATLFLLDRTPRAPSNSAEQQRENIKKELTEAYRKDRSKPESHETWGEYIRRKEGEKEATKPGNKEKDSSSSKEKKNTGDNPALAESAAERSHKTFEAYIDTLKGEGWLTDAQIKEKAGSTMNDVFRMRDDAKNSVVLLLMQKNITTAIHQLEGSKMANSAEVAGYVDRFAKILSVDEKIARNTILIRVAEDPRLRSNSAHKPGYEVQFEQLLQHYRQAERTGSGES